MVRILGAQRSLPQKEERYKGKRGVLKRQSHVRRAKVNFKPALIFLLEQNNHFFNSLLPPPTASTASAALLWCMGSLKAQLLENVFLGRKGARQEELTYILPAASSGLSVPKGLIINAYFWFMV